MGRASRKAHAEMVERRPGRGRWELLVRRVLAQSPSSGGLTKHDFFMAEPTTDNPSILPQSLPEKDEWGDENTEVTPLLDISIGQAAQDAQGNHFQLLEAFTRSSCAIVRCLESGEVFEVSRPRSILLREKGVAYPKFTDWELDQWAKDCGYGGKEDALWRLRSEGLWDMQVRDRGEIVTKLGNWLIIESPGGNVLFRRFSQEAVAAQLIEERALNVEMYPAIERFNENIIFGTLPGARDETEALRQQVCRALLGDGTISRAADALSDAARGVGDKETEEALLNLSLRLRETSPLPDLHDEDFVRRIAPLWRGVMSIRLDRA